MSSWTAAQLSSIDKMLNPKSVAVIGASENTSYGGRYVTKALSSEGGLKVYPVNPRYEEIQGEKAYASVLDIPEVPDTAAIVVPYHAVLPSLEQCHEKGITSAIVISAGFAERGNDERGDLQGELTKFAERTGLRMSGPNCLGLASVKDKLWLNASSRPMMGDAGPIGLVCQSGATLFGPILVRADECGVGLSYAISTGNEADLEFSDFARYLLDDDSTQVIAGFIEGIKNPAKFLEVAQLAAECGKPMVVIKIGRSDYGSRAANSHTAALTGADEVIDAAFRQYGVIRVTGYDDLLETAQMLANAKKPKASGIVAVSHSGGISSLLADMIGNEGLELPALSDTARDGINKILSGFGWASNPADVTGFAHREPFPQIVDYLIGEPDTGTLVVASAGKGDHVKKVISVRDGGSHNVAYMWTGRRDQKEGLDELKAAGIPVFFTSDSLARSLRQLRDYHDWLANRREHGFAEATEISGGQKSALKTATEIGRSALTESEAKQLVAAWNVPVTQDILTNSADDAFAAAKKIGYPVVMKGVTPDIVHKTEAGIVHLNICDSNMVREVYASIENAAANYSGGTELQGVAVQEMVSGGVETIVGVTYDPQLGPVLLFGMGGIMVEVYNDVALRCCPITPHEARGMINEVAGTRILDGARGQPKCDVEALIDVLVNISQMAVQLDGSLAELDINPLLVLPKGKGVKAADALVILKK
jgi:acetate---CoA ligase (ADP-forming)